MHAIAKPARMGNENTNICNIEHPMYNHVLLKFALDTLLLQQGGFCIILHYFQQLVTHRVSANGFKRRA